MAARDTFTTFIHTLYNNLIKPPENAYAITPNDGTDLAIVTRGIYIGVAGNLEVILVGDTTSVIFVGLNAGSLLSVRAKRVKAAGTTASSLLAVY